MISKTMNITYVSNEYIDSPITVSFSLDEERIQHLLKIAETEDVIIKDRLYLFRFDISEFNQDIAYLKLYPEGVIVFEAHNENGCVETDFFTI